MPLPRVQRVLAEETSGGSQTVGYQAMFPAGRDGQELAQTKKNGDVTTTVDLSAARLTPSEW